MTKDLTSGHPARVILAFSVPMMIGNLFQQLYNVVDSIIVGKYIGKDALAAVGSSFTFMVFITSIILGLCMGASVVFSQFFGGGRLDDLKRSISTSLLFIGGVAVLLSVLAILFIGPILRLMNIPADLMEMTRSYLLTIFAGVFFTFLYNWASCLLRALGNSKAPLFFLIIAALTNVVLDLIFVIPLQMGVFGAALATILAQLLSAILSLLYCLKKLDFLKFRLSDFRFDRRIFRMTASYSLLTSVQQSIMNFGILMIQGLVNSFGAATMAAFAAAVKIDSFAYMPVQDFGNAFATYIAQNKGAQKEERIHEGVRCSLRFVTLFCLVISALVVLFAPQLMGLFIKKTEVEIIAIGSGYLHIVALFYCLIGYLFLFYGLFRGLGDVKMSIILTIISLGARVALAYILAPMVGLTGIWWAIPIGWLLADVVGYFCYHIFWRKRPGKIQGEASVAD